jgi:hypothetical protein
MAEEMLHHSDFHVQYSIFSFYCINSPNLAAIG